LKSATRIVFNSGLAAILLCGVTTGRTQADELDVASVGEVAAAPWFWWGFGLDLGLLKGTSIGDGSSEYDGGQLTPLRLEGWVVPCSFAAFRVAAAYIMVKDTKGGHYFQPSVSARFGRVRALDSVWSATLHGGYRLGTTRTWVDEYGSSGLAWVSAGGPNLGLSLDFRVLSERTTRHTVSLGVEVGSTSSEEMSANQYDRTRLWIAFLVALDFSWAL